MTKLIIKSKIPLDDPDDKILADMLSEISNKDIQQEFNYSGGVGNFTSIYSVEFDDYDNDTIKQIIKAINAHRYTPYEKFAKIRATDFELSIDTKDNKLLQEVYETNIRFLEDSIKALDYVLSIQVEDHLQMKEQIETLYNFIHKTGLVSQIKLFQTLIDDLDEKGLLNKEEYGLTMPSLH